MSKVGEFVFNEHGVCLNSELITVYESGGDSALIKLARLDSGEWSFGYDYDCYNGGTGCGAARMPTYPTRQDALLAALDRGIQWSRHYEKWPDPHPQRHGAFTRALVAYKARQSQLTLF